MLNPEKAFFEREIMRNLNLSPSSTNYALKNLYKSKCLLREKKGRMCFYSINKDNPYIPQLKVMFNLLVIEQLVEKLKNFSAKIVLFGSWANGTDAVESDIDLYIVASHKDKILSIINEYPLPSSIKNRKIQPIIYTPQELLEKNEKNTVFLKKIEKGLILWEKEINESNL